MVHLSNFESPYIMRSQIGSTLTILIHVDEAQVLMHKVVGVEEGGVVGIEEGGVNVAVEEGAVQVNHVRAVRLIFDFLLQIVRQVDFGDATLTIASVGFGLLLILLFTTGLWMMHKRKVGIIRMMAMS